MTTNDNAHQPLIEALQAIVQHYANPNLSHQAYRVKACQQAEHALAQYRDAQLAKPERPAAAPAPKLDLPCISIRDVDPETLDTLRGLLKPRARGPAPETTFFSTPTVADSADYFRQLYLLNQPPYQAVFVKENPHCPEGQSDEISEYLPAGTQLYLTPQAQRLAHLERICAHLPQELANAKLAAMRLRRRCWQTEIERDQLLAAIRDALRLLEALMAPLRETIDHQTLDAIEAFLRRHAMTIFRINLTARQEAN